MSKIKRVCLVDDATGMQRLGSAFLKGMGIEVVVARDGYEALRVIHEEEPDACFIDIEMPNLNGLQVVSIMRGNNRFTDIPIAVLSGASSPFDRQKGLLAGANLYLTKPFTKDTIAKAIADMEMLSDE